MILKAARRYANALLQISIERDELEKTFADVELIHNTIEGSRELELFLRSPIIKSDEKGKALEAIFGKVTGELVMSFIGLVIRKGREKLLDQMMLAFIELYKEHKQILDVTVHTARELDDELLQKLKRSLESDTGKSIELQVTTRPELIGGMAVQIRDTIIDGTVRHKLDQLASNFKQAAI